MMLLERETYMSEETFEYIWARHNEATLFFFHLFSHYIYAFITLFSFFLETYMSRMSHTPHKKGTKARDRHIMFCLYIASHTLFYLDAQNSRRLFGFACLWQSTRESSGENEMKTAAFFVVLLYRHIMSHYTAWRVSCQV